MKLKILLLALNAKYIHSSLALRSIKAYCREYQKDITLLEMSINHNENEILKQIYKNQPDIIGISCYIWNMSLVETLLPTLKKILPNTSIILGGPEVSYQNDYLLKEDYVDFIIEGEGEKTWQEYLDYIYKKNISLEEIDGLVYKANQKVVKNKPREALDLNKLPFVYEDLSELDHKIIYYEASRGCPFRCQYCLSSANNSMRFVPIDKVLQHMQYFLDQKVKQVKFVDRTFNAYKSFALKIWEYLIKNDNGITNFHFEIAADLLDEEMLALLIQARKGLFQFEIGIQSTNPKVLKAIQRNMPFEKIKEVILKVKELKTIHQHVDLIAGLPLEDYISFKNSFNDVIATRPDQLQLGFLKLLKGSGLRRDSKKYGIVYKEEAPYEVLYTKVISFDEMLRLHGIEEMLERYYNSGRFHHTLEYLFRLFPTEFDLFEQLWIYWENKHYDEVQHNKIAYYIKLVEFADRIPDVNKIFIRELLRLDLFLHEYIKDIPSELRTVDQSLYKEEKYKILSDEEYLREVSPALYAMDIRHRLRKAHIEYFSYDLYAYMKYKDAILCKENDKKIALLFDYSQVHGVCIKVEEKY